jgi:REP element-mobilizing transposase RayT
MPTKPRNFKEGGYYHIYNRGVEKRAIFTTKEDYQRFLSTLIYYREDQDLPYAIHERLNSTAKLLQESANPKGLQERIKIIAYCLMPNHYHLVLKLISTGGISQSISDIQNSHTKYFNERYERTGVLFQGTFKAKEVGDESSLLQLTRYIHLNPLLSRKSNPTGLIKTPQSWLYSSYQEWVELKNPHIVDEEEVKRWLSLANGAKNYRKFTESKIGKDPSLEIGALAIDAS